MPNIKNKKIKTNLNYSSVGTKSSGIILPLFNKMTKNERLDILYEMNPETYSENYLVGKYFTNIIKNYYNIFGKTREEIIYNVVNTRIYPKVLCIKDNYLNKYKFLTSKSTNPHVYEFGDRYLEEYFDKLNNVINIYSPDVIPIIKYRSLTSFFLHYTEILTNYRDFINLKKIKTILEVHSEPSAFESIEYLMNKYNYNIKNITICLSRNYLTNEKNVSDFKSYFNTITKPSKITTHILVHNLIDLDISNSKYDFLILRIFDYWFFPTEAHYTSKFMPYQLLHIYNYLNDGGSCIFVMPTILSSFYYSIVNILYSWFEKIDIFIPSIDGHIKIFPITYIICAKRKNKLKYINKLKNYVNKFRHDSPIETFKKSFTPIKKSINLFNPIFPIKENKSIIEKIKLTNNSYYTICKHENHKFLNLYNKIEICSKDIMSKFKKQIRIKQYIHSINWAKKYNFNIYEPYLQSMGDLMGNKLTKDYNIYLENILFNINDFDTSNNIQNIEDNIIANINRYRLINLPIDTHPNIDFKKATKTRYYRSSKSEYTLSTYLKEKYYLRNISQAWCKMFDILDSVPELIQQHINKNFNTFHLCEAPGTFISALHYYLLWNYKPIHKKWNWNAQTLMDDSPDKLGDTFGYIRKYRDHWDFGPIGTGNILDPANQRYYIKKYGRKADGEGGVHLATADCGGEEMKSHLTYKGIYNKNSMITKLHITEMNILPKLVKIGGCCLLKSYLPIKGIEEVENLLNFEREFKEVKYIKLRINMISPEYYIIGINKLPSNKLRNISLNTFYNKFVNIENSFLDWFEIEMNRRIFYMDFGKYITNSQWHNIDKSIMDENIKWSEELNIQSMKNRKNDII